MPIRDAVAQARSEYQVYFLLAAYLESVQHRELPGAWSARLTALPLRGVGDLERRRDLAGAVRAMFLQHMKPASGVILECHDLFTLALERLAWLQKPASAAAGSSAP